jgi:Xaa-Pro aminopeptidase
LLAPDFSSRWSRAQALAAANGLDALYITSGPNFAWLTGWTPYIGGWPIWLSCLVVPVSRDPVMVISGMHANIVDREANPVKQIFTYEDGEDPSRALHAAFAAAGVAGVGRVGVADNMWYADSQLLRNTFTKIRLETASSILDNMRAVKDPYELDLLRRSGATVDAIYQRAAEVIRAGVRIGDAGLELMKVQLDRGALHPKVGGTFRRYEDRTFHKGELVDVDTGADYGGYSTDTARNVFIGDPDPAMLELYEVVITAYNAAEAAVAAGVSVDKVHDACARVIEAAGQEQKWKVGHGVGLADGHEAPLLQPGNPTLLEENMVLTIDPGFFIARDIPLHIERTVVVTKDGCERLDNFTHDLLVV